MESARMRRCVETLFTPFTTRHLTLSNRTSSRRRPGHVTRRRARARRRRYYRVAPSPVSACPHFFGDGALAGWARVPSEVHDASGTTMLHLSLRLNVRFVTGFSE
jgi:hypothetical protein